MQYPQLCSLSLEALQAGWSQSAIGHALAAMPSRYCDDAATCIRRLGRRIRKGGAREHLMQAARLRRDPAWIL
eukprot:14426851-Alexandrium_andersonii.AAC.1